MNKVLFFSLGFILTASCLAAVRTVENESLCVSIQDNGCLQIIDKQNNISWSQNVPGWVTFDQKGQEKTISLSECRLNVKENKNLLTLEFFSFKNSSLKDTLFAMHVEFALNDNSRIRQANEAVISKGM